MADKKGFPVLGDTTAVVQLVANRAMRGTRLGATKRRRRRTTAKPSPRKRAATRRRKKTGVLKKGSPEAKRRMAKLRRMQKRR